MNRRLSTAIVCVIILVAGVSYITSSAQETQQDSTTPAPDDSQFIIEGATIQVPLEVAAAQQGTLAASTMSENFEGTWPSAGWQLIDQASNDGGEYLWGKRNCHPRAGSFGGWFLGGGAQGSALACSANYPNNALSWARYGPFDLSHATSAQLTFYLWGTIETSQDCTKDSLISASSADGGTFTDGQAFCGDFTTGNAGKGYTKYILDLSNRLGQSQVWIGFFFISDDTITNNGITLDDITLDVTEGTASFSCNSVAEIPTAECAALVALYNSTAGLNWTNHTGWLATNTPCSWYGITCNAGHIAELFLYNNQLNGTIPSDLSNLQALKKLNLSFNGLNGNVPPQLGNLSNLLELTLAFNQLSGSIPIELSNLSSLEYLDLTSNQLSGTFPLALNNLNRLSTLLLSKNQLSGSVPSELGNLVNLQYLYLDNNLFGGTLPSNLVNLTSLTHFWFQNTNLCEPGDTTFQAWLAGIIDLNRTNVCTVPPTSTNTSTNTPTPITASTATPVPSNNTPTNTPIPATDTSMSIAAGSGHTCAITSASAVKCWGLNVSGELGDGTTINRSTPVDVVGLSSGVIAIAAGRAHTCAIINNGVMCWGDNNSGELGDGTTINRSTPVDVVGLSSGVIAIAVGDIDSCALTSIGGVKCWGHNGYGQLGDGSMTNRSTPVDVVGLSSGVIAIAVGGYHSCALTSSGGAKCWGLNSYGELGDGTMTNRSTPVAVAGLSSGVIAIAAGIPHTCALMSSGGAKCWGYNYFGQLGDGSMTNRSTPVDVVGLSSGVIAITTGGDHTCALTDSGGAKCWGDGRFGALGKSPLGDTSRPGDVNSLNNGVTAIAAGHDHTCALANSGGVKCWGYNHFGELGDGTTTIRLTPVDVVELSEGTSADLGFRPNPNGYRFNNQQLFPSTDKTWEMFEQFFGRENVRKPDGTKCLSATIYAQKNYREMANGWSCFGYSASSLISYLNLPQPNAGAFAIPHFDRLYDQPQSVQLTEPIAYYARAQSSKSVGNDFGTQIDTCKSNSNSPIARIKQGLQNQQPPIIGLNTKKGYAHAVLPYRVEELSPAEAYIYIYDSESYGEERRIHFQRVENDWHWEYTFVGSLAFIGTPQDTGCTEIYLYPLEIALNRGEPPINFCERPTGTSVEAALNENYKTEQVLANLPPEGDWIIHDSNGQRLGWVNGQFVSEIPNGYAISQALGVEPLSYRALYLPEAEYSLEVTNFPTQTFDSILFADGRLLEITGLFRSLNSSAGIRLNSSLDQTTLYGMQNLDSFTLSFDQELPTNSRVLLLASKNETGVDDLIANFDGQHFVLSRADGLLEYSVGLAQVGQQAGTFVSEKIMLGPNETHTLRPSSWANLNSSTVTLEIDRGRDGSVDETLALKSQLSHIYLPLILNTTP